MSDLPLPIGSQQQTNWIYADKAAYPPLPGSSGRISRFIYTANEKPAPHGFFGQPGKPSDYLLEVKLINGNAFVDFWLIDSIKKNELAAPGNKPTATVTLKFITSQRNGVFDPIPISNETEKYQRLCANAIDQAQQSG